MKHFNFNQSFKNLVNNLKGLFILSLALTTFGVGNVWGKYKANVIVKSSPSSGGYVYVGTSNSCGEGNCTETENNASQTGGGTLATSGNVTLYLCHKNANNYIFKGWSTNNTVNSGEGVTSNPYAKSLAGSASIGGGTNYTYYAIFARMTADVAKVEFGAKNVDVDNTATVKLTTVHAGDVEISLINNNSGYFSIDGGGRYSSVQNEDTKTITVHYLPKAAGSHSATLQITSSNGMTTITIPLSGSAKSSAEMSWNPNTNVMNVGDVLTEENVTYSDGSRTIVFTTSNSSVIKINESGYPEAVAVGTANITAKQAANESWYETSASQEVTVTNKQKQTIDWTDDLSFKFMGSTITQPLTATATSGMVVTYSPTSGSFFTIENGQLKITGIGEAQLTATQAGNDDWVETSFTRRLVSRDPNATCDDYIYEGGEHTLKTIDSWEQDISSYGEPRTIQFKAKKSSSMAIGDGIKLNEYYDGDWHEVKNIARGDLGTDYKSFGPYNLNRKTTKIKFFTEIGSSLNRSFKDIFITRAKYLESQTKKIDFGNVGFGNSASRTFTINYSNIQGPLTASCDNSCYTIIPNEIGNDCGDYQKNVQVTVSFNATATGTQNGRIHLTDEKVERGGVELYVDVSANVTKTAQDILWNVPTTFNSTDKPTLSATTTSGLAISSYSSDNESIAKVVDGNLLEFYSSGDVSIIVKQNGDDYYEPAELTQKITVSKVAPTISPQPTATIEYGQKLNTVFLNEDGVAIVNPFRGQNLDHVVIGSFAWTNGDYMVVETGGATHEYDVTFTPSGAEAGMYNSVQGKAIVTVNKATPTLEVTNPEATKIYIDDTLTPKIDLVSCIKNYSAESDPYGHAQNKTAITYSCEQTGAVISNGNFYATAAGIFTVIATAPATEYYNGVSTTITIVVGKHTPVISWKSFSHIYSGQILEDVASASFLGNPVELNFTYEHVSGSFAVDGNKLRIDNQFTEAHNATVRVTTTETDFYAQTSEEHTYYLESKALPKFFLNGVEMTTEKENELVLKVGETATVTFDQIVESELTYTQNAQFVSYDHQTGVITGLAFGNEGFQFHQNGTATVFDRLCQMHIWVEKHEVTLSSPINNNDIWLVDSIYAGNMYTINDDGYTGHAQEEVVVESDNEAVVCHMQDGSWKAVGEGSATLTIRQINNGYWTGDTITRVVKVQKHTPVITWNVGNTSYAWGSVINTPASSTNTDVPFTITSNNPSVANYVNGRIEVYNTTGSVTFTLAQTGNYKWNAATTNLTKSFTTFQPANHVPFTLSDGNKGNFEQTKTSDASWKGSGYKLGDGKVLPINKGTFSVTIHFTGVPDKLSFTKTLDKVGTLLPENGDCNCYVYESADGSSWSQCWKDVERVETKNVSDIQLQSTTRYLKFEYKESCLYCNYSSINVTERSSIEPVASSLDFGTGYNGNTAAKRTVDVNWYSVMPCTVAISGTDASQFYVGDDSKTIASMLDNSGSTTLSVFYTHEENKSHSATLTITSGDTPAKTVTIQLSGKTERAPQEIIWREDITPLPHDGGVYEGAALASSGGEVVLTSDDENVVKVVDGGLQPVGVGTTTVHAYQAGDDIKWQPVNAEKVIEVTSLSVQHLIWDDQLNNIKRSEGNNVNITLTAQSDAITLDPSLTVTYELDEAAKDFASISGNQLTVTGWGSGYITAKQVGNANYIATQKVKPIISRNPDADCKMLAGEYWEEYTLHTIASKEIAITNGEPATIEFDAKMSAVAVGEGMHLDEWYNKSWHEFKYIDWADMHSDYNHYGPYNLNRQSTKVRLYTNTGATMTRTFKNVEITLARYLELAQNDMSFAGVDKGAFLDQTFYINYSNLRGTLDVELKNASSNLQVITTTVGEECGEIGNMIPVTIRCIGNVCGTENNVIVLSNKEQKLEVPITATVVPPSQNITWNPQTDILTTDVVALNATCTSNLPISYSSNNTDVATVQQDGEGNWAMTIIKDGEVTITASQAGSTDWSPAPDKNISFHISKADPVVTSWGTPSEVIKWSTLSTSIITGGEASVSGTFTWQDGTISVERSNSGYTMVFTPTNTNWYNTLTNTIVVPVAKDPQTITWNYTPAPIFCNAQLTFDATASSGLKVRYETSDANIAYVNDNKLYIISGGNVTITAVQDGNDTWAYASLSKDIEILRWTPTVVTLPTANTMLIGQHLDNATLYGGVAEVDNQKVDGSFAWKDGSTTTINVAGMATKTVVFTPSNPNHFNPTTCEVMVEVKKYAPVITHNLIGTAITYGQSLSESVLNGTLTAMDNVKYPSVEVAGSYAWKEPTKKLEAGNHIALVHFTPTNLDWYEEIDVEVPIVVNKAHATSATAKVNMLYGQILDEVQPINTTADALTGIVEGTITWNATVDVNKMPTIGEHDYPIHLAVNDPNYVAETIDGICHVTVEKGFVFDGHSGSTEWNSTDNWVDGTQPTTMEDKVIVIADAIIINSEVNVGAITIKQGVDVTIEEDGVLNVGDYDGVSRKEYGNMIIKRGGQLNLNEGEVQVNNFTLEAALGGTVNESRVAARSGRVDNIESLVVNGDAYFDIALDVNGECSPGWYDLTVPFPVNATTGVQRFENNVLRTNLKCETNYAIMAYHEDVRAEGKYGWAKYHGVMQPGQCYSITIDDVHNIYRFVKAKGTALNVENTVEMTSTAGAGGDAHQGWNGLGNGTLTYATLAAAGIDKVQIYDHTTNSYAPVTMSDKIFAVGSAFFVQTPTAQSMVYNKTNEESVFAPRREGRSIDEFLVTLSKQEKVQDQLYLSASEDAMNTYEIGHDLSKFDVSNTIAQMWCSAYNMKLCDVELPLESDNAIFPLTITTPKAGEYTIAVSQAPQDAQLFLLHNGSIVAELTMGSYVLELNKGTHMDYQLQLVAGHQITTDCEDVSAENNVRKVIFNNKLYIIRDNAIYTATGNKVK